MSPKDPAVLVSLCDDLVYLRLVSLTGDVLNEWHGKRDPQSNLQLVDGAYVRVAQDDNLHQTGNT